MLVENNYQYREGAQLPNIIIIAVKSWGNCIKYRKSILLSIAVIVFLTNTMPNILIN